LQESCTLFAFEHHRGSVSDNVEQICRIISEDRYNSATVSELILESDSVRRPLRREDLAFLRFDRPIQLHEASLLPALAANRILFCLNDEDRKDLYLPEDHQKVREFLESITFSYAAALASAEARWTEDFNGLAEALKTRKNEYKELVHRLGKRNYLREALRFALIQRRKRDIVGRSGEAMPDPIADLSPARVILDNLSTALNIPQEIAPLWQFYLPTTLARWNLADALHRLNLSRSLIVGASLAFDLDFLMFAEFAISASSHLEMHSREGDWGCTALGAIEHAKSVLANIASVDLGAAQEFATGFGIARAMCESGYQDLSAQLEWLSTVDRHVEAAKRISARINREMPNIDRDTFVEPREMCSTTHVHGEHRLVEIEDGEMVFWGAPNMELNLYRGDKILIPGGRLHGSTVTSPSCTYHQPIIPDDWVREAFAAIRAQVAAE